MAAYRQHLAASPQANVASLCDAANRCQGQLAHRAAFVVGDRADLLAQLHAWERDRHKANRSRAASVPKAAEAGRIAFLFPGQGSKYPNMGRQLYLSQPVFRQALDCCDAILRNYLERPLLSVLYPGLERANSRMPPPLAPAILLDLPSYAQAAIFAVEYALARLWQSWGIQPTVLMGQSLGEYAVACIAGVFSLEDGLKLVAHRGRLTQQLPTGGGMLSVLASPEEVLPILPAGIEVAAFNGPRALVLAGRVATLQVTANRLQATGIKVKPLAVTYAFHSSQMEPMLAKFAEIAVEIDYHPPQFPVVSSVTGQEVSTALATPQYWVKHIRQPVRFAQGMELLLRAGDVFLEVGPQSLLIKMGRQCLPADADASLATESSWLPSLQIGQDNWQTILTSLGQLWLRGAPVDWSAVSPASILREVPSPNQ